MKGEPKGSPFYGNLLKVCVSKGVYAFESRYNRGVVLRIFSITFCAIFII